jgi:hypothetical protein
MHSCQGSKGHSKRLGMLRAAVSFCTVAAAAVPPRPQISNMQMYRGGCFDYLFFGKCDASRCTYAHDGQVSEAKVDGVIAKMRPALAQFVSANN